MYSVLLTLLILDAVILMTVVLLQAGKGGGLAAMGAAGAGSDSLFGSRQAANLLTRATWWAGGIFIGLAFVLSLMSGRSAAPESILRGAVQPVAPAPAGPGLLDPAPATGDAPAGPSGAAPSETAPAGPQQ